MKTSSPIRLLALLMGAGLAAYGCADQLSNPAAPDAPEFAKGGNGGGGGKPTNDRQALTAVIDGVPPVSAPANGDSPRVLPDGQGAYMDSEPGVDVYVLTGSNAGSTWLDLRDTSARTFWTDLRPAQDGSSAVVGSLMADACGTDGVGAPCESDQYLNTRVPAEMLVPDGTISTGNARLSIFWKDATHQYRLSYGGGCENDEHFPLNEVDVTELSDGTEWAFEVTDQLGWLLRMPLRGGRKKHLCLGTVNAPFKITFTTP